MSMYRCSLCGAYAASRCINKHNLFIQDMMLMHLESAYAVQFGFGKKTVEDKEDPGIVEVVDDYSKTTMTFEHYNHRAHRELFANPEGSKEEKNIAKYNHLLQLFESIRKIPEEYLEKVCCYHKFEAVFTECENGCCKPVVRMGDMVHNYEYHLDGKIVRFFQNKDEVTIQYVMTDGETFSEETSLRDVIRELKEIRELQAMQAEENILLIAEQEDQQVSEDDIGAAEEQYLKERDRIVMQENDIVDLVMKDWGIKSEIRYLI